MLIRPATLSDVPQMSAFLTELVRLGKRASDSDEAFVRARYIEGTQKIQCVLAEGQDGTVLGFQSLQLATPGNMYDVEPGWGVIGTHVNPKAARRGVGRALFPETLKAAQAAGLETIEATIGASNPEGLGYYDAMGFQTYKTTARAVRKRFDL